MAFLSHSQITHVNHRLHNKMLHKSNIPLYMGDEISISTNIINGLDLGIPLNLLTSLFTELHYGFNISGFKLLLLQCLIGYYCYGKDRYKDALQYENDNSQVVSLKKQELYDTLLRYKSIYKVSYCFSFYMIILLLYSFDNTLQILPIIALLYSTEYYKQLKEYSSLLKPFYVSFMWTFCTVIMPCVLYEHNYNILHDAYAYIPCLLVLFATTNLADIKDIEEDRNNNINTIPVTYGKTNTQALIYGSTAISSLLFGLHPHYIYHPFIHSLFEIQNIGITLLCANIKTQNSTN